MRNSPWWERVREDLLSAPGNIGRELTIEQLTLEVPAYGTGHRPRGRTVARRLSPILELVSRGPNGSRGIGATYRIHRPDVLVSSARKDVPDEVVTVNDEWLDAAITKMIGDEED